MRQPAAVIVVLARTAGLVAVHMFQTLAVAVMRIWFPSSA